MTTYTNPHTAEVAHDTELLRLIGRSNAAAMATMSLARKARAAACTAFYTKRSDQVTYWGDQTHPIALADTPVGTIVEASINGSSEYQVVTADHGLTWASIDSVRTAPMDGDPSPWHQTGKPEKRDAAVAAYDAALDAADAARAAIVEHEKGYTGWNRYVAVVGGHVHRSMECSTCRETTLSGPVPSLAASEIEEAIALLGPTMCTVCFPLAPVDQTSSKLTAEAITVLIEQGEDAFRAKLAQIAAKAAEKCQADPYDHDNSNRHLYRPWAKCNVCGYHASLTSTGKMRAHKPPKGA